MASSKKASKEKQNEILENPEVLAEKLTKTEEYLEKNKKVVFSIGIVIAVAVAGYFLYRYYVNNQNVTAQNEMFQAVYYFEADSLDLALNGDGISYGFLDIIEKYSMSEAANLASYYAGASYLKKGEFEKAINHLQKFSASDLLVQANAYCLTGDANMELKKYKEAADYYEKAANYKPNKQFSPKYLMKAALAYEELEDYESAISTYDIIINQYPTAMENATAKKYKSMLTGKMSEG